MYLNCHSDYSLRYGTFTPETLPQMAKSMGVEAMVLSDINNTSCAFQYVQACRAEGVKPILGIEFRQDGEFYYLGIAQNDEGWRELCTLLTETSLSGEPLPKEAPEWQHCYVVYRKLPKGVELLRDYEYVGVRPDEVNKLYSSYLKNHLDKLVVFSPVTFADEDGFKAHKLLRCIDLNIVIGKLEPHQCAKPNEVMYPIEKLKAAYTAYPQIWVNTQKILDTCHTDMQASKGHNRRTFTGDEEDDFKLLTKLANSGCQRRYGVKNTKAIERTQKELKVIQQMGFCAYFLITWDIVRYAHSVGYFHVGRGSGANSIVAYNLNITDVDPLELDLYFERFINPHRSSPPDFDIDFSWNNRDDVTDYIFKRYGKENTALLATYNTFL